ncbi:MAG TPA: GNAT family N-acetyltransferase [Gaiellaceae bacterium]|nr:GNAT family N-acetyltransferase [Gaiellaceae bacterium]
MLPREVETARLLLRQWRDEDAGPLHRIYGQPGYLETMPSRTLDETRAQLERLRSGWANDGYCQWAACDRETGRLIGRIGIQCHYDWPLSDRPVPEVGWVLDENFWGRGLATEGGRAAVDAWREHLVDEPVLYSFTTQANRRSRAVMARLGFAERGSAFWHGTDVLWHTLAR